MSYSFNVKAATRAEALLAVIAKFDEMVVSQPVHARDRTTALANAGLVIDQLADDETKDVSVSCNGYVSWNAVAGEDLSAVSLNTISVSCTARHAARA